MRLLLDILDLVIEYSILFIGVILLIPVIPFIMFLMLLNLFDTVFVGGDTHDTTEDAKFMSELEAEDGNLCNTSFYHKVTGKML